MTTAMTTGTGNVPDLRKILGECNLDRNDGLGLRIAKLLNHVAMRRPKIFVPIPLIAREVFWLGKVPVETSDYCSRVKNNISFAGRKLRGLFKRDVKTDRETGWVRATSDDEDKIDNSLRPVMKRAASIQRAIQERVETIDPTKLRRTESKRYFSDVAAFNKRISDSKTIALLRGENEDDKK